MNEFTAIADQSLGTLLREFGYASVDAGETSCVYRSAVCELIVGHDSQRSFEVYLALARRSRLDEPPFSSDEIFRSAAVPADELPDGYFRPDADGQRALLIQIRHALARYCGPLLAGDDKAWSQLAQQRETDAAIYQVNTRLQRAQSLAALAWQEKDYASFIEQLSPFRSLLRQADRARLEYAAKKAAGEAAPE